MLYSRIIIAVFLFLFLFYVGYNRNAFERYIAAKYGVTTKIKETKYPNSISDIPESVKKNHKWLFSVIYLLIYTTATIGIVLLIFPTTRVLLTMLQIYGFLLVFSLVISFIGLVFQNYNLGLGLVQRMKSFIQSPLPALIMIIYFWRINPQKR